eukprot:GILK01001532.1.p1 GENE.GILK01001532.1~~GILK01001532.1.p1  ORF type:complete len:604 (+),score=105.96 GILK01001532.1:43-1812(+)
MPTVTVNRDHLFSLLGKTYEDDEFDKLCFEFGVELDDITTEAEMARKEKGKEGEKVSASEEVVYKIDVPANRYDILCMEGLVRALRIFLGHDQPPTYRMLQPSPLERITVRSEIASVRPFVVAAILRGVQFTERSYNSFIDLQDKLHHNICRKRTLVAIGTHDYTSVQGPFTYEALPPSDIAFRPLNQTKTFRGDELMQFYKDDNKLKHFLHIIQDSPLYPVILDSQRVVLSLPPIINSEHSKIRLDTRDVFIECTATDLTKAEIVLNTMVAMYSQYCTDPFTVEPVEIFYESTQQLSVYPNVEARTATASVKYIQTVTGIPNEELCGEKMAALLTRMCLPTSLGSDGDSLSVSVPITRSDVLHACDIAEDVAIAFGYNNVKRKIPSTPTIGRQQPLNKLTDLLRLELANAGYTECLTMALCSRDEIFKLLRRPDDLSAVTIGNPKTFEFQVARTTLLPGLLKTLFENKDHPLPVKLFEVSDVVLKNTDSDVGTSNVRRVAALFTSLSSGFEVIHGLLDLLMTKLSVANYRIEGLEGSGDGVFFPGRQARILVNDQPIGVLGVLHPEVLANFGLSYPASAMEFDLHPFL